MSEKCGIPIRSSAVLACALLSCTSLIHTHTHALSTHALSPSLHLPLSFSFSLFLISIKAMLEPAVRAVDAVASKFGTDAIQMMRASGMADALRDAAGSEHESDVRKVLALLDE